jgi:RHS repeat-associated protein
MIADSTGTTVWRWDQGEPFGNDVPNNNPSGAGAFDFPLRFPGQYFDWETNLVYNYYRDYDSSIGRYVQSDPIGVFGGVNLYRFVRNNPLSLTDVFGLAPCCDAQLPSSPLREVSLTCFAEASNNCRDGVFEKIGITDVIFNRARANRSYWGGSDVLDVLSQPFQFLGYGSPQYKKAENPQSLDPQSCDKLKDCIAAAIGSQWDPFFNFTGFNQTARQGRVKMCTHYFRID